MRWWVAAGFWVFSAQADMEPLIRQLGAPESAVRNTAEEQITEMAEARPRASLLELAEAYRTEEDLEVQIRLEKILASLAREWMFYHPPGFLGVNFRMLHLGDDDKAIELLQVLPEGAAREAGLRQNDRILEINGVDIGEMTDQEEFAETVAGLRPGSLMEMVIQRREKEFRIRFPIGLREPEYMEIVSFSRREEQKLRDWLSGLRKAHGENPDQPLGHFRVVEE